MRHYHLVFIEFTEFESYLSVRKVNNLYRLLCPSLRLSVSSLISLFEALVFPSTNEIVSPSIRYVISSTENLFLIVSLFKSEFIYMGDGVSVCKFRDGLSTTSKNSLNIAKFFERKSMATKNCGVTGGGGFLRGGRASLCLVV